MKKELLRLALFTALFCGILPVNASAQVFNSNVVGYFTSWSVYARDYHVSDIPADKVNYINYAFANIDHTAGTILLGDPYADTQKFYPGDSWDPDSLRGCFHQLQILKNENPHIRTLISVGGYTWSAFFSDVALTPGSRAVFAASCVEFIEEYGFDGVDIDWEYPVEGGLPGNIRRPEDKENFTALLAELRNQLDQTGEDYLLTIATTASSIYMQNLELDQIHQYVDWINIMTYDYHGPWGAGADGCTNFNSPLHICPSDPNPEPFFSTFNFAATVELYIAAGVPPAQIHAGIPFYARGYGNVADQNNGLFASYSGAAPVGTWEEEGMFDYWDIAENYVNQNGYTRYWEPDAHVPWLHNPSAQIMISYDDPESVADKAEYILQQNLGGAMFWEFSADKHADLLNPLYQVLNSSTGIEGFGTLCSSGSTSPAVSSYPNPFFTSTALTIVLPSASAVDVEIFDLSGRSVSSVSLPFSPAGECELLWNGTDDSGEVLPAGVYQSRITTEHSSTFHRMVIIGR